MSEACCLCPRLVDYRADNQAQHPEWHNAPAPPLGNISARLLIVGLAPGRFGANRTGRVFTGDAAGRVLFETLVRTGFATGRYSDDGDDDIQLMDCRITNAVQCAPPGNAPTRDEQTTCRTHLTATVAEMIRLRTIVTLGDIAQRNVLRVLGFAPSVMSGGHGAMAEINGYQVINSYHCSQLNMNTGRLTEDGFADIFAGARRVVS